MAELHSTLQKVSSRGDLHAKFCLFIDGLDEYEGDHVEFCAALKSLSSSAHFKLCVASRPWNPFTDAFGRIPGRQLCIHELTETDITQNAADGLYSHPRWGGFAAETTDAGLLVQKITERVSGVFLWVFLVVRLLRRGLTEYDSYSDLLRRLDSFPSDLETFFKWQIIEGHPIFVYWGTPHHFSQPCASGSASLVQG